MGENQITRKNGRTIIVRFHPLAHQVFFTSSVPVAELVG